MPYSCLSSFAGNALLVSPDLLIEDGVLSPTDCEPGRRLSPSAVDFDAVMAFKHRLLEQAWRNFDASARPALRADFERFCSEEAHWLDDYALFRALKARLGGAYLLDWPEEFRRRNPSALQRARRDLADELNESRFGQFLVSRQGSLLKEYAHDRGVFLIGDLPFIAEDLGIITPDVVTLRDEFELPGIRVFQFGFDGRPDNPHLPHNYGPNTVAYTGTHDNTTTRAWFESLPEDVRRAARSYGGTAGAGPGDVPWDFIRLVWSSKCGLAIAPLQDWLNLGVEGRMNVPGIAAGNWRWRCREEMLTPSIFERRRELTTSADRTFVAECQHHERRRHLALIRRSGTPRVAASMGTVSPK